MTGVVLDVSFTTPPAPETARRMAALLAHRGDASATRCVAQGPVVIGAVPSSFLPEDGPQPVVDEVGRLLVLDGRLDDRHDLERWLGLGPDVSDAAVALAAWAAEQDAALRRLHGDFVVALWDPTSCRVVVARDRIGQKPFFLARTSGGFRGATEQSALFVDDRIVARPNLDELAMLLADESGIPGATLFDGVECLLPGHALVASPSRVVTQPYARIDLRRETTASSFEEGVEALERRLRSTIRERMRARGPVAVLVSGGLDSTTVAAIAKQEATAAGVDPPLLLTTRFPGHACDEGSFTTRVADHLGLALVEVAVPTSAEAYGPSPHRDVWDDPLQVAWRVTLEAGRRLGATVQLTGLGSDETQWKTGFECDTALRERRLRDAAMHAGVFDRPWSLTGWSRLARAASRLAYSSDLRERLRGMRWSEPNSGCPSFLTEDAKRRVRFGREVRRAQLSHVRHHDTPREIHARAILGGLAGARAFEDVDVVGALVGVDIRHPFFDDRLVELMLGMPPSVKSAGGPTKPMLRSIARRLLPPTISERTTKTDFDRYLAWCISVRGPAIAEMFGRSRLARLGLVDPEAWSRLLESPLQNLREITWGRRLEEWASKWDFG